MIILGIILLVIGFIAKVAISVEHWDHPFARRLGPRRRHYY
jgi:hypothetical protein